MLLREGGAGEEAPRLHLDCISAVPRLSLGCTSIVPQLYHLGCASAVPVSRLYRSCASAVPRLYLGGISAASRRISATSHFCSSMQYFLACCFQVMVTVAEPIVCTYRR